MNAVNSLTTNHLPQDPGEVKYPITYTIIVSFIFLYLISLLYDATRLVRERRGGYLGILKSQAGKFISSVPGLYKEMGRDDKISNGDGSL